MAKKVVIGCRIAGYPISAIGINLVFIQWAYAFRNLGWDVWLLEEITQESLPKIKNYNPKQVLKLALSHWKLITSYFDFVEQSTIFINGEAKNLDAFLHFARESSFLLNISGLIRNKNLLSAFKKRVYLDLDPTFTQIWAKGYGCDMNLEAHDIFFTVGLSLKEDGKRIPFTGINWIPTFPPVCLELWPKRLGGKRWSTITHWCGYPEVNWEGKIYGNKASEFEKVIELPLFFDGKVLFQIASDLQEDHEIRNRFLSKNWDMLSVSAIASDFESYRNFIGTSRGEFSVVKNGYWLSDCGWFSDRTVCYLAMGKPAVIQDTGWSRIIPTGAGLLPFTTISEAIDAIKRIEKDYPYHSMKARELAESLFDSVKVAQKMVEQIEGSAKRMPV
ncbi:hypothetical protein A7K93_03780 [Candidatus Methylacidiphilum fumarolicum]|uniref:Glycosyltransferase family 1 protein n=2 Tax=Candidatus Methylacidiphilum fumarolicum TaxID=591154 RepID=I0K1B3_METFB|nr:hypothetical protein [Candidatus Methylacidiphilum fumarolicum]MBW6414963.1 hypothetical protein [Candidatus Methylacidiphilum fumarolicum]TFE70348.1 hypothetical protein A7K73_04035 [Candidatus Methylacidiphilum fumarolicum]TFE73971.1 hypothetical protein A7K72_05120 [Candidatus Methylacidiphilum fumarolicum]TFE74477.1 hypothetical protein A7K93_03780 [Candidatus Methylacidiphilum fumarolicum]TFE77861.1 hypothetical protein A7D33_02605 [Candidatus Methylacidiphilum fumarolicum]